MAGERYQVIIVGGGPVGVALAMDLGLRGISVALVERHTEPLRLPKGQSLTQRSLEHFHFWCVENEIREARVLPLGYPIGALTAYKSLASEYTFAQVSRTGVRPYFYQDNERLPQYLTEEVLRRKLATLPNVTPYWGRLSKGIRKGPSGMAVSVADLSWPNEEYDLEADYVVGCDGAHSPIRRQLGIAESVNDYEQRMTLLVFNSAELHETLRHLPERTTYRVLHPDLKGKWQLFGRVNFGESWFFHSPVPLDATAENFDFHALIQQAAGFSFAADFTHIGFWDMRIRVAENYRVGSAFIAGDAAHSHPPYAGLGLNTGLEDAANLGWKLAAVLEGWGGDRLLDSYSEERQPIFKETGEDVIAAGIERDREFLAQYDPDRNRAEFERAWDELSATNGWQDAYDPKYEPNYEGSPVIEGTRNGVCTIHGRMEMKARAGHHLTPMSLSNGRNVYEELGLNYTLLAFDAPEIAVTTIEQAAIATGMSMRIVRDSLGDGRERYESRLILVRPDQYVSWCGNDAPEDARSMINRMLGR